MAVINQAHRYLVISNLTEAVMPLVLPSLRLQFSSALIVARTRRPLHFVGIGPSWKPWVVVARGEALALPALTARGASTSPSDADQNDARAAEVVP
ncbi:MAG: hypothetical protein CL424_12605 [Acidimicrobiaceae bacterium]|nr:hypothetical protein [Acidimicrobiaceae bacterium]